MVTPLDRMETILRWANCHSLVFREKIKTISDWEKIYDYMCSNPLVEFFDVVRMNSLEDDVRKKTIKEINELLGYNIF